jgi:hypothetical protein
MQCVGSEAFTSWYAPSALKIGDSVENFEAVDAYQLMIEEFGSRIKGESGWVVPLADSKRAMSILDQLRLAP